MTVTAPPRRPETEQDRDLEQRVAELEALIEEARRRARLRRLRNGGLLVAAGAAVAALVGLLGGGGGGGGTAALASDPGARGQSSRSLASLAPLPNGNKANAFAFDPRRPDVVYVASFHARGGVYVFKTTDGGQHWRLTRTHGAGWKSDILSLTSDPSRPGTLYAGTDTAVYKTVDGGRNWRPFNRGLFPPPHKVCSTGLERQCWKYPYYGTPGKANWNRGNGWVLDVAVDPNNRSVVYSAAGGVLKSTDGGHTWKSTLKLQAKWRSVTRIAIAPTRPESIYALAHNAGTGATAIYKSTNPGRTWQRTGSAGSTLPLSCCGDSMDALVSDPANPQTLYADVGNTVLRTTNGGASWQPAANGLPADSVTSLAIDPRQPGTVYASVHNMSAVALEIPTGGIYETTNGGQTWTEIWSGFGVDKVAVDPTLPSTIYAAGNRLLKSTDGGHTWATSH
ncbi:MAG: WD40/YVTN/BNR-like repeat-containing protein [Gaiellaceae bacterium]